MNPLHPENLTWAGLLTQWIRFAQAALAVPEALDGSRWRASVPAIINLQAVTFALADLDRLPAEEHALARDRAEMLIRESERHLRHVWLQDSSDQLPPSVEDAIRDAMTALQARTLIDADQAAGAHD